MKVMLVDDEPFIREGLRRIVDWGKYDCDIVEEAENGLEAIEYLKDNKVDLIFADIKMPGMTGLDMIEKIRDEKLSRAKIVILTGFADFDYARTALRLGIDDYLLKPVQSGELENIIAGLSKKKKSRKSSLFKTKLGHKELEPLLEAIKRNDIKEINRNTKSVLERLREDEADKEIINAVVYHTIFCLIDLSREIDSEINRQEMSQFIDGETITQMIIDGDDGEILRFLVDYAGFLYEARNQEKRGIIDEVDEYIDEHYCENLSLAELGEKFYVNKVYLGQLFKKKHDMLFKDYIASLRINDAEKLLMDTDMRVYAIAEKLGFTNADNFISKFVQFKGVTPNQYRLKNRMKNEA